MFFRFMRGVVRVVLFLINGNARYQNKEVLPKNENYILVAPHRTWWDPLYLAVAARPKKFSFYGERRAVQKPDFTVHFDSCQCFSSQTRQARTERGKDASQNLEGNRS